MVNQQSPKKTTMTTMTKKMSLTSKLRNMKSSKELRQATTSTMNIKGRRRWLRTRHPYYWVEFMTAQMGLLSALIAKAEERRTRERRKKVLSTISQGLCLLNVELMIMSESWTLDILDVGLTFTTGTLGSLAVKPISTGLMPQLLSLQIPNEKWSSVFIVT